MGKKSYYCHLSIEALFHILSLVIFLKLLAIVRYSKYSEGKRMSHPWPFIGVKWLYSRGRRARKKYFHGLELELFQLALIRPLKWGRLRPWTSSSSQLTSHQSWKKKKRIRLSKEVLTLEPLGVQGRNLPHFKGLINAYWKSPSSRVWRQYYYLPRPLEKGHFTPKMANRM